MPFFPDAVLQLVRDVKLVHQPVHLLRLRKEVPERAERRDPLQQDGRQRPGGAPVSGDRGLLRPLDVLQENQQKFGTEVRRKIKLTFC